MCLGEQSPDPEDLPMTEPDYPPGDEPPSPGRHPSILEFVLAHTPAEGPGMTDGGYTLPDEEAATRGSGLRWAAGAWDGVTTHHMGAGDNAEAVRRTVELVLAFSEQPTAENQAAVHRHVIAEHIVSIIDQVIQALLTETAIDHGRLYTLTRSLVTESSDREPVKFGIAVLGLFRQPEDRELFLALGRHDEFTLFCAVALANSSDDRDLALWTLARTVTGWGRIQTVERLAHTENPEIKNWLLREGYRNSVMYEYLAAICARAGGLPTALAVARPDRELLTAAGEILQALIAGGPAEGIDDYEDARPAIESYLGHMASCAERVDDFLHVNAIRGYLAGDDGWARRYEVGWTAATRDSLRSACDAILGRPEWLPQVRAGLGSADQLTFAHADQAARALGIDTWDTHWKRLQEKPTESGRWYHVMALTNEDRIGEVVAFAEQAIDLAAIATGPRDELGLGRGFEQHSCLDYVLQDLRRFPGRGAVLIEAGLRSPVVRNRNMALNALAAWPRTERPREIETALERAAGCEPREDTRERMHRVLKGEPLDP